MKSIWNSVLAGGCHVLGLSLLVLSATVGGSTVRAASPSTLQDFVFDPMAQIVLAVEQRVADLETTVAAFAGSFTSDRVVTQELCVADASAAQTCISKAQLDALLRGAMQVGQAPATIESGAAAQASADKSVLANAAVTMPTEMQPATEPSTTTADDAGASPVTAMPSIHKPASAAADESAMPVLADTTGSSYATLPSTARVPAAAGEHGTPLAGMTTAIEPAEPINATQQPVKNEEPAYSEAAVKSPAPERNMVPAETPPGSECQE